MFWRRNRLVQGILGFAVTMGLLVCFEGEVGAATANPQPAMVDLGLLPGGRMGFAVAINDAGWIVGSSDTADSPSHAVRWNPQGEIADLGTLPGGNYSLARAINNSGTVVGYAADANGDFHAVRWDRRGRISDLGAAPGHSFSMANKINDRGEILGESRPNQGGESHVVRWTPDGRIAELGSEGVAYEINNAGTVVAIVFNRGPVTWDRRGQITYLEEGPAGLAIAVAINDAGTVAGGTSTLDGFGYGARWDRHGRLTRLGALSTEGNDWASAINDTGTAVGSAVAGDFRNARHAVRWDSAGRITDLGTLEFDPGPWMPQSYAEAINDAGIVIGVSWQDYPSRAVRWDRQDRITDLGTLGGDSSDAHAINDSGLIVGAAHTADGLWHPVLWRYTNT